MYVNIYIKIFSHVFINFNHNLFFSGFFIDDDLLYEDILGPPEEEMPLEDFYESDNCSDCSWGSEEWDTYDSEQEEMVHSYVEAEAAHSPKGAVERGGNGGINVGSSHRRSMVSAYSMEKAPQREEAKVGCFWHASTALYCTSNCFQ